MSEQPETYNGYTIWHSPAPDGNPDVAWRFALNGSRDPDLTSGHGPTREDCIQQIDMIEDMDRDLTIEEADAAHRMMVKVREATLFREAPMIMRNLLNAYKTPRGSLNAVHAEAARRWLSDYDNRQAPLDTETMQ